MNHPGYTCPCPCILGSEIKILLICTRNSNDLCFVCFNPRFMNYNPSNQGSFDFGTYNAYMYLLHIIYIYIHICIVCVCDQYIRIQVTNVSHTSSHNHFVGPIIYTNIHTHIFVHVYVYSVCIYIYICNYLYLYNMLVHGLPKQNTLN